MQPEAAEMQETRKRCKKKSKSLPLWAITGEIMSRYAAVPILIH